MNPRERLEKFEAALHQLARVMCDILHQYKTKEACLECGGKGKIFNPRWGLVDEKDGKHYLRCFDCNGTGSAAERANKMKTNKPLVEGEIPQLRNALQKIRFMIPVPDPDYPDKRLSEILEIADKMLGYHRAYHSHDEYLTPEVLV